MTTALTKRAIAVIGAATLSATAHAQGFSTDVEMLVPKFDHGMIPGVELADGHDDKFTIRWGIITQYQMNPLTGYRLDEEVGPIVSNRFVTHLGAALDISKRFSVRLVIPFAVHWGSDPELEGLSKEGPGLGDISTGAKVLFAKTRFINAGASFDLILPTGRAEAYMGEKNVRGHLGLLATLDLGPLDWGLDVGIMARAVTDTEQDFVHGSELTAGSGLRLDFPWLPFALTQSTLFRSGFANFGQGGAENAVEMLGGVQVPVGNDVRIDVMGGRGLTQGSGTTDLRVMAGVSFQRSPRPRMVLEPVLEQPPPPPPVVEVDEPAEEWEEGELARVEEREIVIHDPINFELNTANILAESLPVLSAVSELLNGNALIAHVVIEGHASEEGSFAFNYRLSLERAQAVWRQLIINGVHHDRLSYRGMGEVIPKKLGEGEEELAENRRVEFRIVAQYSEFDTLPEYGEVITLPWSGEQSGVVQPMSPEELDRIRIDAERREQQEKDTGVTDDFDTGGSEEFDFEGDGSEEAPLPPPPVEETDGQPTDTVDGEGGTAEPGGADEGTAPALEALNPAEEAVEGGTAEEVAPPEEVDEDLELEAAEEVAPVRDEDADSTRERRESEGFDDFEFGEDEGEVLPEAGGAGETESAPGPVLETPSSEASDPPPDTVESPDAPVEAPSEPSE